jgi:hypothetical protein
MADVIGISDVSSPDTGKGSKLKTGGINRRHNMPSKEKCKTMVGPGKKYKTMDDCLSYNDKKMGKTQKAGTSKKDQKRMVGKAMAESQNVRMRNKLKANVARGDSLQNSRGY